MDPISIIKQNQIKGKFKDQQDLLNPANKRSGFQNQETEHYQGNIDKMLVLIYFDIFYPL